MLIFFSNFLNTPDHISCQESISCLIECQSFSIFVIGMISTLSMVLRAIIYPAGKLQSIKSSLVSWKQTCADLHGC